MTRGKTGEPASPPAGLDGLIFRVLAPRGFLSLPSFWRYGLALVLAAVATLPRWAPIPALGIEAPYNLVLVAIILASVFLGTGPGLTTALLGNVAAEVFVLRSFPLWHDGPPLVRLGLSIATGVFVVWLLQSIRASHAKVRRADELRLLKDGLEELVEAQTESLRESEARYRTLIENAPVGIFEIDLVNRKLVSANDVVCRETGYSHAELLSMDAADLLETEDRRLFLDRVRRMAAGETVPESVEYRIRTKTGALRWALLNVNLARENGIPVKARVTATDITDRKEAGEALRRRSEELAALLDLLPAYVWLGSDPDCRVITGNRAANEMIGLARGANISQSVVAEGMAPYVRQTKEDGSEYRPIELPMQQAIATRQPVRDAYVEFVFPDGRRVPTMGAAIPLFDASGAVRGSVAALFDITERKRTEARMAADLEAMTRLQKLGTLFAQEGGLEPVLTEIVDAAIAISGADFGNIQLLDAGTGDLRIVAHRGFPQWWIDFWNTAAKGQGTCGAALGRGERVVVEDVEQSPIFIGTPALEIQRRAGVRAVQSTPLVSRTGKVLGMFSTHWKGPHRPDDRSLQLLDLLARQAADIIARTQDEAALRQAGEMQAAILNNTHVMMACLDRDFNFIAVNDVYARAEGREPGDFVGRNHFTLFPSAENEAIFRRVVETGEPYYVSAKAFEYAERPERGTTYWDWSLKPVKDAGGRVTMLVLTLLDVTARVRAEAALRNNAARFRSLADNLPSVLMRYDRDFRVRYLSPSSEAITGIPVERFLGKTNREAGMPETLCDRWEEAIDRVFRTGENLDLEFDFETARGPKTFFLRFAPEKAVDGTVENVLGISTDITEHKRAEELRQALAEQEKHRLGAAVEQASDGVIMVDLDGTIRYVNAAFEAINGIARDAAAGTSYFDLLAGEPAAAAAIRESVAAGRPWHGALTRSARDGYPVELEVTISPAKDPSGAIIGGLVTEKDVTRENALQNQVRQSQKMEALGTLAGGITHDFNNILGTIILNTELALLDLDPTNPARRPLPLVLQAANRGKDLVKQIITFSRQRTWERKPLEIAPIIKEGLSFLRTTLPKDISIQEAIDSRSGVVLADPSHIHQILVNLCQNAALAMRDVGGRIGVGLAPVEVDEAMTARHSTLKPGPYARLTVSDMGCGMTKEVRERIFEPFFTTRGPGEGSGLGLAVVHGIVRTYDGEITVASEPGKGSTFDVYFPRLAGAAPKADMEKEEGPQEGEERVLLVEDEDAQRKSLERGLGRLGYKVTARTDGRSALEAFSENPAAFDVVITDQIMPRMSGLELASAVRALRPAIPVILCTGFSEKVSEDSIGKSGVRELLMKPFTLREATRLIRKVVPAGKPTL